MFRVLVAYFHGPGLQPVARLAANAVTLSESLNIALFMEKRCHSSRRLDFYLLVHGRCFYFLVPPIETNGGVPPIRHLGTRPPRRYRFPEGHNIIERSKYSRAVYWLEQGYSWWSN
ncbi:hypothetical protein TNCV_2182081 [Trichonephila clavipes]|uniref:Uncharacterized protein n=1 Tax=Trichonephila clavipes TaxID=2585209 RepID=A0A8X6VV12_TRICX|nr:hypothetical protein TNCV_2182081 [Trichonephila clavipes]